MVALQQSTLENPNSTPLEIDPLTKGPPLPEQSLIKSFNELSCHCSACCHCHHGNIPSKACTYHQQSPNLWRAGSTDAAAAAAAAHHQELNEVGQIDAGHSNDGGSSSSTLENCLLISSHELATEKPVVDDQDKMVAAFISSSSSSNNSCLTESTEYGPSAAQSQNPHLPLCIYTRGKLNNCVTKEKTATDVKPSSKHGVSPKKFRKCSEEMGKWFSEFNDEQRNIFLKGLLKGCELPQLHLLSVKMEANLHRGCPPNCQDILTWLPTNLATKIMSFLDPVSLCQASQVCKIWRQVSDDPCFWRRFCCQPKWRLSKAAEHKQVIYHMSPEGSIQWKKVFAERFRLRNNWLKGRCTVRTFEGHTQGISCIQFDDTRIVSGSSDKTIRVWNIRTNAPWSVQTLVGHSGTVRCLHLEGNRLVSGSSDKTIKVWDLSTQDRWSSIACKVTMVGHLDTVRCLQADDEKVISGSYDKTLKVWDIRTGECKMKLRGHLAAVLCVRFSDTKIVSGSCDKTIKVWNFDGTCMMTLTGHQNAVTCLQFDSTRIVSGSLDCNLKFWDIHTGECINTIDWKAAEGHTGVVRCLQSDSWRVVSAADDKTIKVWNLETGKRLITLRNHSDGVTCLQFNDLTIVSGSYDKTVKLWDFSCC